MHPHDIGTILDREGIAIRTGQHCAQPVMDRFCFPPRHGRRSASTTRARKSTPSPGIEKVREMFGMTDLRDLYQEVILDHNKSPHNYREMPDATRIALGNNPLCGDKMKLYVKIEGDRIADVAFQGSGCAISKASASLMTDAVMGKCLAEAEALYGKFHDLLTGPPDVKADGAGLGKLAVFSGVREFPVRVKCATLAWHTLESALKNSHEVVKTE